MENTQMKPAELLEQVNKAIAAVLVGGQSYKIGSRSLTRADLSMLKAMRDDLEARGSGIQLREVAGGWRLFTHPAYHELIEKYGDVRYCEGMPAPDATSPAFIIWNPREKTPLLPYDVDEAIALNQQRGDLGTMFESEEDLKVFDEGTIGRDELKMKHGSVIELMRATRNDMA